MEREKYSDSREIPLMLVVILSGVDYDGADDVVKIGQTLYYGYYCLEKLSGFW